MDGKSQPDRSAALRILTAAHKKREELSRPRRWGRNTVIECVCFGGPALVVGHIDGIETSTRTSFVPPLVCYQSRPRALICAQVIDAWE